MNTDDITKLATEAGFNFSPMPNMLFTVRGNHAQLVNFAALVTQAERESRQAAQAENEQLKARLARSGVELRKAVRDEREACAIAAVIHSQYPITTDYDEGYDAGRRNAAAAIRARNQPEKPLQQVDCTDCECADNDPCKRTAPGLALESGEFVPAEKITGWAAA